MSTMQLRCPSCGSQVVSEDVNVARLVAKCRACSAVFGFEGQVGAAPRPPTVALSPVAMPEGITLHLGEPDAPSDYRTASRGRGRLVIERRWHRGQGFFNLLFAIGWNAFLVHWYRAALEGEGSWVMLVFPVAHVAAGVWVTYTALTNLFNTTTFEIDGGVLRLRHGPIPARGARELPTDEIVQLYTEEHRGSKDSRSYALVATVRSGPAIKLVEGLQNREQVTYIERTIESHLDIEDAPPPLG